MKGTTCLNCGDEFTAKRSTAKYCSPYCRIQANRGLTTNHPHGAAAESLQKQRTDPNYTARNRVMKDGKPFVQPDLSAARKRVEKINDELEAKGLPRSVRLGADIPPLEFISSGIPEIDAMTKGFPRKRVTEIFGLKGVGKTSLMLRILNALPDLDIYYIDAENGIPDTPPNVVVDTEHVLEHVVHAVERELANGHDLIVIDSVASLVPRAEVEGDSGDMHMGLKARLMSQWMRRINFHLSKSDTAVVFINQQREAMDMYGPKRFTPGGLALGYAASLRLELKTKKADRITKDGEVTGHWVTVEVEKSRVSRPYQTARFKLNYE